MFQQLTKIPYKKFKQIRVKFMDIQKNIFTELREISFVIGKFGETQDYCIMFCRFIPNKLHQNFKHFYDL